MNGGEEVGCPLGRLRNKLKKEREVMPEEVSKV
jgi:hypothetical protein